MEKGTTSNKAESSKTPEGRAEETVTTADQTDQALRLLGGEGEEEATANQAKSSRPTLVGKGRRSLPLAPNGTFALPGQWGQGRWGKWQVAHPREAITSIGGGDGRSVGRRFIAPKIHSELFRYSKVSQSTHLGKHA